MSPLGATDTSAAVRGRARFRIAAYGPSLHASGTVLPELELLAAACDRAGLPGFFPISYDVIVND